MVCRETVYLSVSLTGTSNTPLSDLDFSSRVSGVFGGKINEKLGAVVSILYRNENFNRQEASFRGYRLLDIREDTNDDGVFNTDDGDQLYENMLIPGTINT